MQSGVSPPASPASTWPLRQCVLASYPRAPVGPPPSPLPWPTGRQLTKFVNGIQGGFRVMVLLILLIHPLLLCTRQGQHLNAYTRGETGRQIVVGMGGKRKWFCIWTPDLLPSLAVIPLCPGDLRF